MFPFDTAPRYVIRDRDRIYGDEVVQTLRLLGVQQKLIAHQSPWQCGHVERVIGSIRRECLDHVIVLSERHPPHYRTGVHRHYAQRAIK